MAGTKHLVSPWWEPHVPGCVNEGVFASIFPGPGSTAASPTEALWTVVNRAGANYSGSVHAFGNITRSVCGHLPRFR